jgi:hypothetical protein
LKRNKCDCGNIVTVRGYNLLSGGNQSCGCLKGRNQYNDSERAFNANARVIVKRNKYKKGSSRNPDKTRHVYPNENSSRIGQIFE